jgi:hypothetical protein
MFDVKSPMNATQIITQGDPLDKSQTIAKVPLPDIEINHEKKQKITERSVFSPKKMIAPKNTEPIIEYRFEEYN